ncbi:alpha-actinin [Tritrichomonas musculus]|uniref:Alpha-actinin n=1 Tax=Tritrichomonas musculus TaxID=1915356 RepID=A0ABR2IJ72_9EUKA
MKNNSKMNNLIPLQTKVFSRWISNKLKWNTKDETFNIFKDLSDGTALVELAQTLTHHKVEREWAQKPNLNVEKVQNCDLAIDMFSKDGVRLVGISGKDINDNNEKLILGLIWSLILHYSIEKSSQENGKIEITTRKNNNEFSKDQVKSKEYGDVGSSLLSWANNRIEKYSNVQNLEPYDMAICALLNSYFPDKIKYGKLKPENHQSNMELAIKIMDDLKIPVFVYLDDFKKSNYEVDEKTLLIQLAFIKNALNDFNSASNHEIVNQIQNSKDEKESESDSTSFISFTSEEQLQTVKEEVQPQIKQEINDDELADEEDNTIDNLNNSDSKKKLTVQIGLNKVQNLSSEGHNIRIKIKRRNAFGPNKKVEKTVNSKISKLHIVVNKKQQNQQDEEKISQKLQEEEERIRKLKEEEAKILKQIQEYEKIRKQQEEEERIKKLIEEEEIRLLEEEKELENEEVKESKLEEIEEENSKEVRKVRKAKIDELESESNSEVKRSLKAKIEEDSSNADEEKEEVSKAKNELFEQKEFEGRKFGLIMAIKGSKFQNGEKVGNGCLKCALTLVDYDNTFLNQAGKKLDLTEANVENNVNQQFVFGQGNDFDIIKSELNQNLVWDVADADSIDPPSGTPFYLFPIHGKHNQRFVYKNQMIYATQNDQVVTYVGGETPFVMMQPSEQLKSRQTFRVKLL